MIGLWIDLLWLGFWFGLSTGALVFLIGGSVYLGLEWLIDYMRYWRRYRMTYGR